MKLKEKFSIENLSLKRKFWIALALISILPLLLFFYYFRNIPLVLIFIILGGWLIIFEIFSKIDKIYFSSKKFLKTINEEPCFTNNEVKNLEQIIESFSLKVKNGLEQLRILNQEIEKLNREVSQKVLVFSTILEGNDLFSKGAPFEEIINFFILRLEEMLLMKNVFCCFKAKNSEDFNIFVGLDKGVNIRDIEKFLKNRREYLSKIRNIIVVDRNNKGSDFIAKDLNLNNIALVPILLKRELVGFVCIGNNLLDFVFNEEQLNILKIFSQNINFIWESKELSKRVEELEILDYLTELYNEKFILRRLDEEIKRASVYQRPCSFLLMEILNYQVYQNEQGIIEAEKLLKKVANIFKEVLRPIDIAGRLGPGCLGAILIEKNKRQAQNSVKEIEEKMKGVLGENIKLAFGVGESPIDGIEAQELIKFAKLNLKEI